MTRNKYGTGSVRQTGPNRWQIRWSEGVDPFTGNHIRRSETVHGTKTDANRMLAARTASRGRTARVTFGQLLDATLPALRVADVTRSTYGHALAHVPDGARAWVATDITPIDARHLIDGLAERHGAQTVRKAHAAIRSCWAEATRNGWVTGDPWARQKLPSVPSTAGTVLDADEVAKLLAVADELEQVWLRLHLATGARPGEVVGDRWSHIDTEAAIVTFIDAKHRDRQRPVAIDETTVSFVTGWQTAQRRRALAAGVPLDADPFLISSEPSSAVPWRRAYAGGFRWRQVRTRAGIRPSLRLYDLRHTHNSWLAAAGIDEATRGRRVGNSPAVNLRTYSHATRDRDAAAIAAERMAR